MNAMNILFKILPRLIALYILWDAFSIVLPAVSSRTNDAIAFISSPSSIALLLSAMTSTAAVVLSSITMYIVSLVLLALGKGAIGYIISPIPLIGLGLMLALDTIALGYREGQGKSINISSKNTVLGILGILAILGLLIGGAAYAGYSMAHLVVSLTTIPSNVKGIGMALANLMTNPLTRLVILTLATLYLYKLASDIVDIVLHFVRPSRELSLAVLRNMWDVDVVVEYPLQTLFSLIASAIVVPVVYEFVSRILMLVIPIALEGAPYVSLVVSVVIYITMAIIVSRYVKGFSTFGASRKHIVLPALLALMVYITAVFLSLEKGFTVPQAILNPDFSGLSSNIYSHYLSFYTSFFYVLEVLTRLVGVAP